MIKIEGNAFCQFAIKMCISSIYIRQKTIRVSHPEEFIEKLYIFNFNESQYMIRILTLRKWESYEWIEVKYNIRNHRYEGFEPILDEDIALEYYIEYYISQFIKNAYKLDITDTKNPRIIHDELDDND